MASFPNRYSHLNLARQFPSAWRKSFGKKNRVQCRAQHRTKRGRSVKIPLRTLVLSASRRLVLAQHGCRSSSVFGRLPCSEPRGRARSGARTRTWNVTARRCGSWGVSSVRPLWAAGECKLRFNPACRMSWKPLGWKLWPTERGWPKWSNSLSPFLSLHLSLLCGQLNEGQVKLFDSRNNYLDQLKMARPAAPVLHNWATAHFTDIVGHYLIFLCLSPVRSLPTPRSVILCK